MITVTTIGTCRLADPVNALLKMVPGQIGRNQANIYGYVHAGPEVVQQIEFLQGRDLPSDYARYIANGGAFTTRVTREPSDLLLIEISSLKELLLDSFYLQLNHVVRRFGNRPRLLTTLWSNGAREARAARRALLELMPEFWACDEIDRHMLSEMYVEQTSAAGINDAMATIRERMPGALVFVTHIDAPAPNGKRIAARAKLARLMRAAAEHQNLVLFDPTPHVMAAGPAVALLDEGRDLNHYAEDFLPAIGRVFLREVIAPALAARHGTVLGGAVIGNTSQTEQPAAARIESEDRPMDALGFATLAARLHADGDAADAAAAAAEAARHPLTDVAVEEVAIRQAAVTLLAAGFTREAGQLAAKLPATARGASLGKPLVLRLLELGRAEADPLRAMSLFATVLALEPTQPGGIASFRKATVALRDAARALASVDRAEEARALLRRGLDLTPRLPMLLLEAAVLAEASEDWTEALGHWRSLVAEQPAVHYLRLARAAQRARQHGLAVTTYARFAEEDMTARRQLAAAQAPALRRCRELAADGDLSAAAQLAAVLVAFYPDHAPVTRLQAALRSEAQAQLGFAVSSKDQELILRSAETLLLLDADSYDALKARAEVFERARNWHDGAEAWAALAVSPRGRAGHWSKAARLFEWAGEGERSAEAAARAASWTKSIDAPIV